MEALVTKINAFAPKSDQLFEKLAELDKNQAQLFKTLDNSEERWKIHTQDCIRLKTQLKATVSTVESMERSLNDITEKQLPEHQERIQHLEDTVAGLATKATTSEATQRTMSARIQSIAAKFAEQLKQQSDKFQVC